MPAATLWRYQNSTGWVNKKWMSWETFFYNVRQTAEKKAQVTPKLTFSIFLSLSHRSLFSRFRDFLQSRLSCSTCLLFFPPLVSLLGSLERVEQARTSPFYLVFPLSTKTIRLKVLLISSGRHLRTQFRLLEQLRTDTTVEQEPFLWWLLTHPQWEQFTRT